MEALCLDGKNLYHVCSSHCVCAKLIVQMVSGERGRWIGVVSSNMNSRGPYHTTGFLQPRHTFSAAVRPMSISREQTSQLRRLGPQTELEVSSKRPLLDCR